MRDAPTEIRLDELCNTLRMLANHAGRGVLPDSVEWSDSFFTLANKPEDRHVYIPASVVCDVCVVYWMRKLGRRKSLNLRYYEPTLREASGVWEASYGSLALCRTEDTLFVTHNSPFRTLVALILALPDRERRYCFKASVPAYRRALPKDWFC